MPNLVDISTINIQNNMKGRKSPTKSPLRFQSLRSSFPLRTHGSTRSTSSNSSISSTRTRRSLQNAKAHRNFSKTISKAEPIDKKGQKADSNGVSEPSAVSTATPSSVPVAASIEGRRISNRQRKPSCRLSFSHFELTLNRGVVPTAVNKTTTESIPPKKDVAKNSVVAASVSKLHETSSSAGGRNLRKRVLESAAEINETPPLLSPHKYPNFGKSSKKSSGLENSSISSIRLEKSSTSSRSGSSLSRKSSLSSVASVNANCSAGTNLTESPPVLVREDHAFKDEMVSRRRKLGSYVRTGQNSNDTPGSEKFSVDLYDRKNCYCSNEEDVFALKESLEIDENLNPYCQAVDLMDGKSIACTLLCPDLQLHRVSSQCVFKLLCSGHKERLKLHHCCPFCDQFCTQGGGIYLCTETISNHAEYDQEDYSGCGRTAHFFHKTCAMEQALSLSGWTSLKGAKDSESLSEEFDYNFKDEEILSKCICPHCGAKGDFEELTLEIRGSTAPVFFDEKPALFREMQLRTITKTFKQNHGTSLKVPTLLSFMDKSTTAKLNKAIKEAKTIDTPLDNNTERSKLRNALENEDLTQFMAVLLSTRADPNERFDDLNGQSILHLAVALENFCFIHALITSSADPNVCDHLRETPLMIAASGCKKNTPGIIKYLVAAGSDLSLQNSDGKTALHIIAKEGHLPSAQSLSVETDVELLTIKDNEGKTPLMASAEYGHSEMLRYLISVMYLKWNEYQGQVTMDVDILYCMDKLGNNVLHWAAYGGIFDATGMLSKLAGAKVVADLINGKNNDGDTPLHVAVKCQNAECALGILISGGDPSVQNVCGKTPIDLCVDGCDTEVQNPRDEMEFLKGIFNQTLLLRNRFVKQDQEYIKGRCRIISNDIAKGREINRIPCVNEVDEAGLDSFEDFTYVTSPVITNSRIQPDVTHQSVHRCSPQSQYKNAGSDPSEASDARAVASHAHNLRISNSTCSTNQCNCYANSQLHYLNGRLNLPKYYAALKLKIDENSSSTLSISECNQFCSCDVNLCQNRVVQKGSNSHLEVFRTSSKNGWGVRTRSLICSGSFVCELIGELISSQEASKRTCKTYIVESYRSTSSKNSSLGIFVDAMNFGNVSRFLNHSCEANLILVKVFVEHSDHRFPRLALFANRDVSNGEVLTLDYEAGCLPTNLV